ncbi:MAG: peptidase M22, partial [Oscillospiraceae bacterium]|nr:peptidase M22 [Oscillospiraceae bacterium]
RSLLDGDENLKNAFVRGEISNFTANENKCKKMIENGEPPCDIALYCIKYIESALSSTCDLLLKQCGSIPIVFSGGVMSNSIIRKDFEKKYGAFFAEPAFSADNACGIAYLVYSMYEKENLL